MSCTHVAIESHSLDRYYIMMHDLTFLERDLGGVGSSNPVRSRMVLYIQVGTHARVLSIIIIYIYTH